MLEFFYLVNLKQKNNKLFLQIFGETRVHCPKGMTTDLRAGSKGAPPSNGTTPFYQ